MTQPTPQVTVYFSFGYGHTDPDTGEDLLDLPPVVCSDECQAQPEEWPCLDSCPAQIAARGER